MPVHTCFSIGYNGTIRELETDLENGKLDLDAITELLGIEPFNKWVKGCNHQLPVDELCPFSIWSTENNTADNISRQCLKIVKSFESKIPELIKIRSSYNVDFSILISSDDGKTCFNLGKAVIEFCYLTGTSIKMA